jgi:hypothetical protein
MQLTHTAKAARLGAMAITVALLGGCDTYGPTATELDYGNSVRNMVKNQTVNPGPVDEAPVEAGDGVRTRNAIEVYRTDVGEPANVNRELVIGADGSR